MYSVVVCLLMTLAVHAGVYHSRDIIQNIQQKHERQQLKKDSTDLASNHHNKADNDVADNEGTPDMILTDEQKEYLFGKNNAARRGMAKDKSWLWPNGIIPWQFDNTLEFRLSEDLAKFLGCGREKNTNKFQFTLNTTAKQVIRKAMEHVQSKTCIRFKRRTNETGYINFVYGKYCSATVGYIPGQGLNVTISRTGLGCTNGSMVHELGHVIGFYHEQSRPDRDNYVRINWTNILNCNETVLSFQKHEQSINSSNIPYDYASVMHYSRYFLAKDPRYPTVIPTRVNSDGSEVEIGYAKYLSPLDIKQANLLYGCKGSGRQTDEESDSGEEHEEEEPEEEESEEEEARIQI